MPQAITNAAVIPILECVLNNGGGSYTARFGYENDNTVTETIAVGDSNKFSPTPTNRGQTTTFQVGRQHYVFNVNFNGSNLVWTLKGPDNTARTATASSSSTACPVPVANPGPSRTVATGSTVQLDGTGSTDPSGLPLTYQWSLVSKPSGSTATLSSATAAKPTFVADKTGRFEVHLVVSDTYFSSPSSTVNITAQVQAPVANPGPSRTVATGSTVLLDGTGSTDPAGLPLTYQWSIVNKPAGSTATLSSSTAAKPTFVADKVGTYEVHLVVSDTYASSPSKTVNITAQTQPPIANAGPNQTVTTRSTVPLDGSGSTDPAGLPLTYSWSFVSRPTGSTAALSSATALKPTFVVDKPGTYTIQLVVSDQYSSSAASTVTVSTINSPPVANAGANQTVATGTMVQLDGSQSTDVDGDPLTFAWAFVSIPTGSTSALSNATIVNPTFVTDKKGTYVIQLVANDGHVNSTPSQVTISDTNTPPVANAGPNQSIQVGTVVHLDGSHSTDVDGDTLVYSWSILSAPSGSTAALSDPHAVQPTFTADLLGNYVIQLVVNDGTANDQPATVTISTNDVPPVADAGPNQTVTVGTLVTLNGTGSTDSDGHPLTFSWSLLTKPAGSIAALVSPNSAQPTFQADLPGDYVVQLMVNDGFLNSAPANVTISTNDVPPVANPGPNQTVSVGATVQLDGTGSTDSVNHPLTYQWSILSQPNGGTAALSSTTAAKPTFVANAAGLYVVQLIVNDGYVDSQPATMTVTANSTNQPPVVNAGPNQTVSLPTNFVTLNGTATDDGLPNGTLLSQWSQVSGPGSVTFNSPNQAATQVTLPVVGTYVLQLSANDSQYTSTSRATVVLTQANQPPVVTVGPDQIIVYPANSATLIGTATDDGLPVGSSLQISWSKVVGPGSVTFANPAQTNTTATFSLPGNYILRLSASDGQYTSSATLRVAFVAAVGGGISVSAGPDQIIVFPDSATLTGSASDSNPPVGSSLSVGWSVVSGPGTAIFANPAALGTTVTFSAPGVYFLRFTATNGTFTAASDVKIYAGQVQCTLGSKGTDFWLMFTGAATQVTSTNPPRQLSLFISSDVATSGTVSVPGQGLNLPFTVTPGQIATVNLPQSVQVTTSDTVEANGIHVTSQNAVAVYGLNFVPAATDGYLGLPTNTLGTSYVVATYRNTLGQNGYLTAGTEFGLTAAQDNTTVTIVPTATTGSRPAHLPFTIQLNQGQTYQLRNITDHTQLGDLNGPPVDFTGTVVTSDKPVAVFGGHDCTDIPDGSLYCNSLVEQLPPTNLWGQNFVTMPLAQEFNGDTFRFLAQADDTHVLVNHQEVAVLQTGQFFEQIIKQPSEISANHPILTLQYANSLIFANNSNTDPSMIVVPPFEQFGGSYTINTPTSNFPSNFVNVIAPTSAVQGAGILLDGAPISAAYFQPIGTSPFSGAQVSVEVGPHTLTAGLPFGLWVYGFNAADAYGYTGGVCLAKGVSGSSVTASPKSTTNQITSQVTVQAAVTDSSGQPVGGTGVTFVLAGINSQTSYATTNASGVAAFTYTSLKNGSDLFTITAGTASDTASVTWVSNGPNQPPVVRAGPNQTISQPANSVFLNGSVIDDGLPIGGTLTSTWTQLSGPAAASFGTTNQPQSTVTFPQAGTYVLQLTGNDSQLSTSANVTVTVLTPNQPPVVSAGQDQAFLCGFQTPKQRFD